MRSDALQTAFGYCVLNMLSVCILAALVAPFARRCRIGTLGLLCAFVAADTLVLVAPLLLGWRVGHWNWTGKLASIALSLTVMRLCLGRAEVGWQRPATRRAVAWTVAGVLVAAALAVPAELLEPSGYPDLETFLFEATLPGLDEELALRGIGFALLLRALSDGPQDGRAPLLATLVSTLWFTTAHVLNLDHGHLRVSWHRILDVLPLGLWFTVIRLRSASLLGGVLAHNATNLVQETLGAFGV